MLLAARPWPRSRRGPACHARCLSRNWRKESEPARPVKEGQQSRAFDLNPTGHQIFQAIIQYIFDRLGQLGAVDKAFEGNSTPLLPNSWSARVIGDRSATGLPANLTGEAQLSRLETGRELPRRGSCSGGYARESSKCDPLLPIQKNTY